MCGAAHLRLLATDVVLMPRRLTPVLSRPIFCRSLTSWLVVLLGQEVTFTPWGIVSGAWTA